MGNSPWRSMEVNDEVWNEVARGLEVISLSTGSCHELKALTSVPRKLQQKS